MKKIILFMTISLLNTHSFTFQDLQSTLPTFAFEEQNGFLDAASAYQTTIDVVIDEDDDMPNIQEYDQYISDATAVSKPSTIEIALQKMMGVLLVHYMSLRAYAHEYFSGISNFIVKWYHNIVE